MRHYSAGLAAIVGLLGLWSLPAGAQTRFEWPPESALDVSGYTTVEDCLAATDRAARNVTRRELLQGLWRDTLRYDEREALAPLPLPIRQIAERCAARFTEPAAPVTDFAPLLELYLLAGRDRDAASLMVRRLKAIDAKADPKQGETERVAVLDTAARIHITAKPLRLIAAEQALTERVRATSSRLIRFLSYTALADAARTAQDTVRAMRAASNLVAVADSLTDAERESSEFQLIGRLALFFARNALMGMPVFLDGLRQNTAAFVALKRANWVKTTGLRHETLNIPMGERAPAIEAEFFFDLKGKTGPRPVPGRVNLVLFTFPPHGVSSLVSLRRLAERFPTVEITVVSWTRGSFTHTPPPATPAEEAELFRQWMTAYRVPGVLAVATTPFWRLPGLDRRRIDKAVPVITKYTFGKSWAIELGSTFLIDQDGVIVHADMLSRWQPREFEQMIEVLLQRPAKQGAL